MNPRRCSFTWWNPIEERGRWCFCRCRRKIFLLQCLTPIGARGKFSHAMPNALPSPTHYLDWILNTDLYLLGFKHIKNYEQEIENIWFLIKRTQKLNNFSQKAFYTHLWTGIWNLLWNSRSILLIDGNYVYRVIKWIVSKAGLT